MRGLVSFTPQNDKMFGALTVDETWRFAARLAGSHERHVREIADRLGIPVKTVHSRLERALGRLRVRLDSEYGDRSTWALAFAPLLRPMGAAERHPQSELFDQALSAFEAGDFGGAAEVWSGLADQVWPGAGASGAMAEQARAFTDLPPENWTGVLEATSK